MVPGMPATSSIPRGTPASPSSFSSGRPSAWSPPRASKRIRSAGDLLYNLRDEIAPAGAPAPALGLRDLADAARGDDRLPPARSRESSGSLPLDGYVQRVRDP